MMRSEKCIALEREIAAALGWEEITEEIHVPEGPWRHLPVLFGRCRKAPAIGSIPQWSRDGFDAFRLSAQLEIDVSYGPLSVTASKRGIGRFLAMYNLNGNRENAAAYAVAQVALWAIKAGQVPQEWFPKS